jgi:uncharacterized membrane protein
VTNPTIPTTKTEYLSALRAHLSSLPASEVEDILRDQEEYIRDATDAGRAEADVIRGLGEVRAFAQSLSANYKIERAAAAPNMGLKITGAFSAIFAILALAPLNLLFVLGPFLVALALLVSGWATVGGLFVAAIASFFLFFFELLFLAVGAGVQLSAFFFLCGTVGLCLLAVIAMAKITQWFVLGTLAYLKWNVKFIQARA